MTTQIPLLLIPGMLCDEVLWQHQVNNLKDIADSSVAVTTQHDSIDGIARALLEKAPQNFALVGLSMGGYVALEIMRQAPERVLKLALFDTSARADTPEQTASRKRSIEATGLGPFKGVSSSMMAKTIHPSRLNNTTLTNEIVAMAQRIGRDAFIRQQTAIINRADSLALLPSIRCPTLAACGREDLLTPLELITEIAQGIPGAQLEIVEKCGHLSPLECPDEVNALLRRWLSL